MKKALILSIIMLFSFSLYCFSLKVPQGTKKLVSQKDKASYVVGYNMGLNLARIKADLDMQTLLAGLKDALGQGRPLMTTEEMQKVMRKLIEESKKRREEERTKLGEKNKQEGEAFLKKNAKKEGVKVTDTGLQYEILKQGAGKSPGLEDTVELHYRGTLTDGTEFHNSYKRDKPVAFQVGSTPYAGWREALQLMKVGSKWKIYLPGELAFGERGLGDIVGPYEVVIFELEIFSIKPAEKKKTEK